METSVNNKCKAFTSLEQSKKLTEILPLESADMYWWHNGQRYYVETKEHNDFQKSDIPCWSLAALLNLCPTINGKQPILTRGKLTRLWYCYYEDEMDTQTYDNPVDAVFEMIQLLHEQKLL